MIHEANNVIRELIHRERRITTLTLAKSAQVRRDKTPACGHGFELRPPHRALEGEAVYEYDRITSACFAPVQPYAIDSVLRHGMTSNFCGVAPGYSNTKATRRKQYHVSLQRGLAVEATGFTRFEDLVRLVTFAESKPQACPELL
jgi:hypothetical protein